MMTLFSASTGYWTKVMYINGLGCDAYDEAIPYARYPELCTHPSANAAAYVFFPCFVLLGNIVLLTLFIGIVCAEMDSMALKQEVHVRCCELVEKFTAKFNIPKKQARAYTKLFALLQDLKQGHTADVDYTEMKGILHLLELVTSMQKEKAREERGEEEEEAVIRSQEDLSLHEANLSAGADAYTHVLILI
jgi:hypothetical protein